jgi:hypothetical protein
MKLAKFKFENLINQTIFICDADYFNNDNIEIAEFNNLNFVVMSKQIARQNNNKNRGKKWNIKLKDGKKNMKKDNVSKKQYIHVVDAHIYPFEREITLDEYKPINGKYNKQTHIT